MADTDIITLDEAMTAISMTGTGAQQAGQVSLFVSAVSDLLDDICGPIVERTVTETIDAAGNLLFPTYSPVASITSITEYVSGTGTVLTAETSTTSGDYLLRDDIIARRSGFFTTTWDGSVTIVYVAGRYASTEEVGTKFKLAAQEIIAREWPQYASAWSRGGDVFGAPEGGLGFFKSVEPVVNRGFLERVAGPRLVRLGEREHVRVHPRPEMFERNAQCPQPAIAADHGRRRGHEQRLLAVERLRPKA